MANNLPEYIISFGRGPSEAEVGPAYTSQATKGRLSCDIYMITEQKTIILDGELKIDQNWLPICREGPKAPVLPANGRRRSTLTPTQLQHVA